MKPMDEQAALFWEHVQNALDERRDPREDEGVQASIALRPECLEELERLLMHLEQLPQAAAPSARRRVALVAVLALASAALLALWLRSPPATPALSSEPAPDSLCRFEYTREIESPGRRTTIVSDNFGNQHTSLNQESDLINVQWTTQTIHPNRPRGLP